VAGSNAAVKLHRKIETAGRPHYSQYTLWETRNDVEPRLI
jgi:hypothetical protein